MKFLIPLAVGLVAVSATPTAVLDRRDVSTDGSCGGTAGLTCKGSAFGDCCSQYSWCGTGSAWCGAGCQSGFGTCDDGSSPQPSPSPSTPAPSPAAAPEGLVKCLNGKEVPFKMSSDEEYAQLAKPYNLRVPFNPAVIVLPTTEQHVQDAVVCAGEQGIKCQAKSGGHSYANFNTGGINGAMQINLQSFQTIELAKDTGIAVVGGGVRLGNLGDGIYNQGKAALAHGTCPGVGIGGHYTHGGYGQTSRNWGLAMDQIVGAEVVTADGKLVKTSATESPDLFWAIRGAADSFGIVTKFYLQTRAAPDSITYFSFGFQGVHDSKDVWTKTFLHVQDVATNSSVVDNRISFGVYLDGYKGYSLSGAFFGSVDEFNSKIKPELLRGLPTPSNPSVESLAWYDYLVKISGKTSIKVSTTGYDDHEDFFAKSVTVPESSGLTSEAIGALYDHLQSATSQEWYIIMNLYGGPGSAINKKDISFAAYDDRKSLWVFQNWGYGATPKDFINGINDAIINAEPQTNFGAYLNYVDPTYDAATAHKLYYGEDVTARLTELKAKVDPKGIFWNPQAIGA